MKKDKWIFKDEFPAEVGIEFDLLRQWVIRSELPRLMPVSTMPRDGKGPQRGLYSLAQALEYKKQKDAIRPLKSLREGGE